MATLYTEQSKNVTKTWLLMTVFFMAVIGFGWFFSIYYGNSDILYFFVLFSILMNFFSYWFSDKIVLKLAGAKLAKREENFDFSCPNFELSSVTRYRRALRTSENNVLKIFEGL